MNNKTFLTYKAQNGTEYEYRRANGMNVAPMGCWIGDNDENGEPTNESDNEFDAFLHLYVTDYEFYDMTDEELNNEYKDY